jgi:hypothetical protein
LQSIWEWVDQDVDRRAWYLASFVPKKFFVDDAKPCIAREILIRYGDRKDVRSNLAANFSTESWMGPQSDHVRDKVRTFQTCLESETHPQVRAWLQEYIDYLLRTIDRATQFEERELLS